MPLLPSPPDLLAQAGEPGHGGKQSLNMSNQGILPPPAKAYTSIQARHSHGALLKLMGTHSQITVQWLSWSKWESSVPYALQMLSYSQQACTIHTRDTCLSPGHYGQGSWCSWAPQDDKNWKDSSWQATASRHWNKTPVFLWKWPIP